MDNQELHNYIEQAHLRGQTDEQIKASLLAAGWTDEQVSKVLIPKPIEPPMPVAPSPVSQGTTDYHVNMWIVFQYILMFITLAVSAISLAGIAHYFIDQVWGTTANTYGFLSSSDELLGYVAALLVGFPIFAFLFIYLRRQIEIKPVIRNIKARKLFIYIALLWTFIVLLTRLVTTVYSFLEGSQNVLASLAHFLVTMLISGSIFLYFVLDVKKGYDNK